MTEEAFVFPPSFAQARLWFLDQLEPGSSLYNVPIAVRLTGSLQVAVLEQSLGEIVRRHEALRTTFPAVDGQPVQVVKPSAGLTLPVVDLRGLPEPEREKEALRLATAEVRRPFDLARGPLLRTSLLRLSAENYILVLAMHHIIADGWSLGVLLRELASLYAAFAAGQPSPLSELPIQYADYAVWQRDWLQGEVVESQLSYWKEQLAGISALGLPGDRTRPAVETFRGARQSVSLPKTLAKELKALSRQEGVTLFMTLLAAFDTLLHRYTGQDDIAVGSPVAARNQDEIKELIGFFVNTLVLRADLSHNPTFRELLGRVREVCLEAYTHQDLPFEQLVAELHPQRDLSRNPLFQVMFALQNAPMPPMEFSNLTLSLLEIHAAKSRFDLTIELWETPEGLGGLLEYNTDLFKAATVTRMMGHFQTLLESVVADPEQRLADLRLLTAPEKQQLREWNDTRAEYPEDSCVHELFEAQVERTPDAVAVVFPSTDSERREDESLTYRELNRRANQLAHHLRKQGVGPETLVGICVERSPEMVVGLLGVLKAGGAYLPLDPGYPQERLAAMLQDAQVPVLLTQAHLVERLPNQLSSRARRGTTTLRLDADWGEIAREPDENLESGVRPDNLAYAIYTSGSTGRPKGVLLQHRGLCNLVLAQTGAFGVEADSRVLQFASFSFDASVSEVFMALLTGAQLHLARQETLMSMAELWKLLRERAITTVTLPPSVLRLLPGEGLSALQTVISAGEACDREIVARWSVGRRFINAYGPTEATIGPTLYEVQELPADGTSVPIGRPIANTQIHLLDANGQAVPVGVPGEVHVGGVGVARGYLKRPELTAERFIPDPFVSAQDRPYSERRGARLYRTGDLARYRGDGNIEFLGRVDDQVKVRGYRVEPGEIEVELVRHRAVREAVVVAREETPGDPSSGFRTGRRLVGYVVPNPELPSPEWSTIELRDYLRQRLPEYMVPSALVTLEGLPLTPSGKVDREALPAPEGAWLEGEGERAGPRTPVEELLVGMWQQVLGVEQVGVHDSFFDLGGHSLLATQVISRLRETFEVELPVRQLFEAPTVAEVAERIGAARRAAQGMEMPPIERVSREEPLPLSYAQQRLWFLDRLEPGSAFYNVPAAARLRGALEVGALEESLNEVVERHEALRTTFATVKGQPVQVIAAELRIGLPVVDLTGLTEGERETEALRLAREEAQRPFDLARGPMLRARLLRLSEGSGEGGEGEEHLMLLTMHHIVSDHWSMGVTIQELAALYQARLSQEPGAVVEGGAQLPELAIQYGDFAAWQRRWLDKEALKEQLSYWKGQLEGLPPLLELPTDRARPALQTFRGGMREFRLLASLSRALEALSREEGTTLFMTLLAAFQTLLYRYTGQEDISVGTPIANRNRAEIEGLIGFFVNTLVLRGDLSGGPSFRELLGRVREVALGAYDHQDVPFEMLVDELRPARDLSHTPLFQVMFAMQNAQQQPLELPGLELRPVVVDSGTSKFDLTLSLEESEEGLRGHWNYNRDLFDAETIERMIGHWETLLEGIVADPDRCVADLPLLTEAERRQLLVEWNDTAVPFPRETCIHHLFEEQVAERPEALAALYASESGEVARLSYDELNRQANQLAHYLQCLGIGPETLVGICVERSPEMVVGILGILKAGGAYLPLDPSYPEERLAYMLQDAQVPVLLTQAHLVERLPIHPTNYHPEPVEGQPTNQLTNQPTVICLDADWGEIAQEPDENPRSGATAESLAYVIYTSGSTGRPKGVLLQHRGLCNLVLAQTRAFGVEAADRVLQFASFSFDAAVSETFMALLTGATLCLAPQETLMSPSGLRHLLQRQAITTATLPPSVLKVLPEEELDLKTLISAGEACPFEVALRWSWGRRFFNAYGPTEATIGPTLYEVQELPADGTSVPIGQPIANTQIYLLDANGQAVPVGVPGEAHIGGVGVARGYLKRPELTAERFIPDPFVSAQDRPYSERSGERLYRTGDLARYRPDGNIEFLGRVDDQVKVRGFRVEPGEIEVELVRHRAVREAVVVAREDAPEDKRLVGYVVLEEEAEPTMGELRGYLRQRLPEYMVPSVFVTLEALPLTPSGKVDRKALPAPTGERPDLEMAYVRPQNEVQHSIAAVWEEVLGIAKVGIHDNFFDLGGHSLMMAQVHDQLQQMLSRNLTMVDMFRYPTISALTEYLNRSSQEQPIFQEDLKRASRQKKAIQRQKQRLKTVSQRWR